MSKSLVVGFPRIGEQRELKKVLEKFWAKKCDFSEVENVASELKKRHWLYQKDAGVDFISSNDFSLYDNMLDTSIMLGAIPKRFKDLSAEDLYFSMARGDKDRKAMQMTKWFNTNYHYIVPELSSDDVYKLNAKKIVDEYNEAKELGVKTKINIIGIFTYLGLSNKVDGGDVFSLFGSVLEQYAKLFEIISALDDEIIVQIDEPYFVKGSDAKTLSLVKKAYDYLCGVSKNIKVIVTTYFEHSNELTRVLVNTPLYALGLDFIYGKKNIESLELIKNSDKVLIAGVVDGRNIWKNDFTKSVELLESFGFDKDKVVVSTSCSLLHVPYTLKYETNMDDEIKTNLSYALEKLDELTLLAKIYSGDTLSEDEQKRYNQNKKDIQVRKNSKKIHNADVQDRVKNLTKLQRDGEFSTRLKKQKEHLNYSDLVTTTIGSFPQTPEVREARKAYKSSEIDRDVYESKMKAYIDDCIKVQEDVGIDVLVHGEPERNDMVEYFGEMMDGFGFSKNAWVQSYGSRCVKPPFIYADVSRPEPMTLEWIKYAQSKTNKPMKGMLSGPLTMLNWSFVRDDIPRSEVSKQLGVALSDEISDLQDAGIKIIQVDEAAFKEGYPLREENIKEYENNSVRDFKISVSTATQDTQIHTHMCYSEFNSIIKTIEDMDADVISIETARSGNTLLKIFKEHGYKQEVGPGVYDIHSPRVPSVDEMVRQIDSLLEVLPSKQLWINPDCGLKTRKYEEVIPSLKNMVEAVNIVKARL